MKQTHPTTVVRIDPDIDPQWRDTIGNLVLVPVPVAALLDYATPEERLALLGVTCPSRHLVFMRGCVGCLPWRTALLQELVQRARGATEPSGEDGAST